MKMRTPHRERIVASNLYLAASILCWSYCVHYSLTSSVLSAVLKTMTFFCLLFLECSPNTSSTPGAVSITCNAASAATSTFSSCSLLSLSTSCVPLSWQVCWCLISDICFHCDHFLLQGILVITQLCHTPHNTLCRMLAFSTILVKTTSCIFSCHLLYHFVHFLTHFFRSNMMPKIASLASLLPCCKSHTQPIRLHQSQEFQCLWTW